MGRAGGGGQSYSGGGHSGERSSGGHNMGGSHSGASGFKSQGSGKGPTGGFKEPKGSKGPGVVSRGSGGGAKGPGPHGPGPHGSHMAPPPKKHRSGGCLFSIIVFIIICFAFSSTISFIIKKAGSNSSPLLGEQEITHDYEEQGNEIGHRNNLLLTIEGEELAWEED